MAEKPVNGTMDVNKARFYSILYETTFDPHERFNIGTYKEKNLHRILKRYFEEDPQYQEVPTCGFVADIRRDGIITEIETNSFTGLKPKLEAYLPEYTVRLVYPVAAKKTVSWIDPATGDITARRPSPKRATVYDAIFELVRLLPYVNHERLTVLAVLLEVDEYRFLDGWSRDRKRGSHRFERMPADLYGIEELSSNDDLRRFIPERCTAGFSTADFAEAARIPVERARGVMKVFEARGLIGRTGKRGNTILYDRLR